MLERERDLLERLLDVARDGADVPAGDVRPPTSTYDSTDSCRIAAAFGTMRTSATSPRAHESPVRRVDQQALDVGFALADLLGSPHRDVEHLLFLEQVPDDEAREERRRGAAHVARRETVLLGAGDVRLHLDRRLVGGSSTCSVLEPVDPAIAARTSSALVSRICWSWP